MFNVNVQKCVRFILILHKRRKTFQKARDDKMISHHGLTL